MTKSWCLWPSDMREPVECLCMFTGHTDRSQSVVFHPDSTLLASASYDGTCMLWDLKTRRPAETQLDGVGPAPEALSSFRALT